VSDHVNQAQLRGPLDTVETVLRTVLSLIMGDSLGLACSKPTRATCCTLFVTQARLKEKQSLEEVKSSLVPQDSLYLPLSTGTSAQPNDAKEHGQMSAG
jgi:hypothetical protein